MTARRCLCAFCNKYVGADLRTARIRRQAKASLPMDAASGRKTERVFTRTVVGSVDVRISATMNLLRSRCARRLPHLVQWSLDGIFSSSADRPLTNKSLRGVTPRRSIHDLHLPKFLDVVARKRQALECSDNHVPPSYGTVLRSRGVNFTN